MFSTLKGVNGFSCILSRLGQFLFGIPTKRLAFFRCEKVGVVSVGVLVVVAAAAAVLVGRPLSITKADAFTAHTVVAVGLVGLVVLVGVDVDVTLAGADVDIIHQGCGLVDCECSGIAGAGAAAAMAAAAVGAHYGGGGGRVKPRRRKEL